MLELLIRDRSDAVLIPVPQYPLYSASVTRQGGTFVGYELDEEYNNSVSGVFATSASSSAAAEVEAAEVEAERPLSRWAVDVHKIERICRDALKWQYQLRAIVVINPGNPTGNVLSRNEIESIIDLAYRYNFVILADEVYQENVYRGEFHSFREVLLSMGAGYRDAVELFSFHSISKGYYGECGFRAGYVHLTNIDEGVRDALLKLLSMNLCSNVCGQALLASVLNPPVAGDPSFDLFSLEKDTILGALTRKAELVSRGLNSIDHYDTIK